MPAFHPKLGFLNFFNSLTNNKVAAAQGKLLLEVIEKAPSKSKSEV
jgi:hypothetical protein